MSARDLPAIALVTPVLNGAAFIEQTICSILEQRYIGLEYVVVDGGSTDGTIEIIRRYERHLQFWMSEPDAGMYDAINKGFAHCTADIMGWLNASDVLHLGALRTVGTVFNDLAAVEWITSIPTLISAKGMTVGVGSAPHWSRTRFLGGANRYIQQESTFWRRRLWDRAGGAVSTEWSNVGDFELWARFFRHAELHTVRALIGGFRAHPDSLTSRVGLDATHQLYDDIVARELRLAPSLHTAKAIRAINRVASKIPRVRGVWHRALYGLPGPDWPREIEIDDGNWRIVGRPGFP